MQTNSIVLLASKSSSTRMLYNSLIENYSIEKVIIENTVPVSAIIKNKIKRLGFTKLLGQILFQLIIVKLLSLSSSKRIKNIQAKYNLSEKDIPKEKIAKVSSVNSNECRNLLQLLKPSIIIVNGTRIISEKTLSCVNAFFLNIHTGITPMYRGVHGGYWALVNNDIKNCGVTVHLVDKGIDTGGILYQKNIDISKEDSFVTYPYIQLGVGKTLLLEAINDIFNNKLLVRPVSANSQLWSHPTIWEYFRNRIRKRIH